MRSLEQALALIDDSIDEMAETMVEMIRFPALAPVNGGDGEGRKADYLMSCLKGFDSVQRVDVQDETDPSVMRPNILAVRKGQKPGTVWIIAHMDVVPAGDLNLWDTPPFDPVYRDGKVYGRGTEDNGQSIISSMYASRSWLGEELKGMSMGIAYVADEETTSKMGVGYLLDHGFFREEDVIIVPDWGSPGGSQIEISEKHLVWLRFSIEGKTAHGSTPNLGINAYRVSTRYLSELMDVLEERFGETDGLYIPPMSTFEPTKRPATVENVNTIPGHDEFSMDIRLLPAYEIDDVISAARELAAEHEERTGAKITVSEIQRHVSGKPASTGSKGFVALSAAVESVTGRRPAAVGVGGGTCANFFRARGMDAYVWQCGGGTLHAPNEHAVMSNLAIDAKVFTTLYYNLCVKG